MVPAPSVPSDAIKALCITEDLDRPTTATFIGLHQAGVDMTVICPDDVPLIDGGVRERRRELVDVGVRVPNVALENWLEWRGAARLGDELERGRYDIVHLFSNRALQNALRASRGLPVRIIAYRGIVGNVSFFNPVSWMRFLNPRIDRIVCVADAIRDYFLHMKPVRWRLPAEKLVRIYKGHDLAWYAAAPADLEACGIPRGAFVVGCVANYRPRKGIEYLIDAIAALPAEWQVHLLLAGRMDAPELTKKIASSPAAERIHELGYRSDAPALAAACDVFALTSIKREGLARSLIEAMANAVPPIVTDCGGSPELVVDGECGLVVPVRDAAAITAAIGRLYEDPATRKRMGAAARRRIGEHFRIEDTIAQTLALYRSLVPRSG